MSQAKYDQRHEQGACPSSCPVCSPGRRLAFVSVCACEIQFLQMSKDAMHYNGTEGIAGSVFLQGYGQIDVVSDIGSIPLPDESFDLVICTDVLEHVLNPKRAMHEMGRLLKPGGMVLLQDGDDGDGDGDDDDQDDDDDDDDDDGDADGDGHGDDEDDDREDHDDDEEAEGDYTE
eukprot:s33_g10.t1